ATVASQRLRIAGETTAARAVGRALEPPSLRYARRTGGRLPESGHYTERIAANGKLRAYLHPLSPAYRAVVRGSTRGNCRDAPGAGVDPVHPSRKHCHAGTSARSDGRASRASGGRVARRTITADTHQDAAAHAQRE